MDGAAGIFASIPHGWKQVLKECTRWRCTDDRMQDQSCAGKGWEAFFVRKNWLCRCHGYASIVFCEEKDALATLEDLWMFASNSLFFGEEGGKSLLYIFRKDSGTCRNHRMLLALFRHQFVMVDVRLQKNVCCSIEVVTEICSTVRIEHLLMEGPMSSWYHPCCNDEITGTCEEAIEHMRDGVRWECIHTPHLRKADWDEHTLAFAMSQHERLGALSTVPPKLDCNILDHIFRMVQREPAPPAMSTFQLLDWLRWAFYESHFLNIMVFG